MLSSCSIYHLGNESSKSMQLHLGFPYIIKCDCDNRSRDTARNEVGTFEKGAATTGSRRGGQESGVEDTRGESALDILRGGGGVS